MTSPSQALIVSPLSQQRILKLAESVLTVSQGHQNFRARLLEQDLVYYRELSKTTDQLRGDAANRMGDANRLSGVTIPVVGPQVDSAVAFFVEMFLSSYPVFPVVAPPEHADAGLQLETILGQSAIYYQWPRHLAMAFRDGFKHNILAVEVDWRRERVPYVATDLTENVAMGVPRETDFEGNSIKRISPYNLIFDHRVPITESHSRGEFAGYSELITRSELKKLFLSLDNKLTMNATQAFESGRAATTNDTSQVGAHYLPAVNPRHFAEVAFTPQNWLNWANLDTKNKIKYHDMYEKIVLYAQVIPKELAIYGKQSGKNPGDPQIYKFILINRKVLIYVQRMTNAHNMLPIIIGQMNEDGHGLQTKSYADNATPYQHLASSLFNAALQSQRRKVHDRILYDPSRINKRDIDNTDPVARIPVKQEAYGKPLGEAVFPFPYRDDGIAALLSIGREMSDMADVATGSNRVQRGQFQKGNKTRFEVENVMGNSDARPKTSAILLAASWFQPIKEILKFNILQYQPPATLFNQDKKQTVEVKPTDLRKISWEFQLADGVMPSDKFLNFELFGQVLQYASANPAGAAEWDLTGMFAYQLKAQGARWVDTFRRTPQQQQQYLTAVQQTQNPGVPNAAPQ